LQKAAISSGARPRHVAMVIQRFRPLFSGQGVQLEELCRALARRGIRSTIMTAAPVGAPSERESCDGYEVRRFAVDPPGAQARARGWMTRLAWKVGRELWSMRGQIDVVHAHALSDALYASLLVARCMRVPFGAEMTLLGDDDPLSVRDTAARLPRLRFFLYRRCDGYVAMSNAFAGSYRAAGLPAERLRVIPQGVDTNRFRPADPAVRAAIRAELGLPESAGVVLFAGSLIRRKGLDLLLRAWRETAARHPGAWLLLVGQDRFRDAEMQRFADETIAALPEPARSRVVRTGVRDDLERVMQAADVLAFPTRREGFGTVMLEAMASTVPCVVARLPGITDLVFGDEDPRRHGGIIVEQEDAAGLAGALSELLGDPAAATRIGAAGRTRAVAEFDFERIAAAYVDWYASMIGGSGGTAQRQ